MSYRSALVAAGAEILEFQEFGDWQGSWVALVEYNGERGWVQGSFGSCTECDSFQAEFGWDDDTEEDYEQRLADFGRPYLDGIVSTDFVLFYYSEHAEWDSDAEAAMTWIRETAQQYAIG